MRLSSFQRRLWPLALILGLSGCDKLDTVSVPGLVGPSDLGLSLQLTATPDILNADGISQSIVKLVARDQNGAPAPGKAMFFQLQQGDGFMIAGSVLVGPLQSGVSVTTDNNGVAQVVYNAGTSFMTVIVSARPYSFDAGGQFSRSVQIIQR
jgi:hypothetical protein